MRSNLLIFTLTQILLILLFSVISIALHYVPDLEKFLHSYTIFRIVPVILMIVIYMIAGKFMSVRSYSDMLNLLFIPLALWCAFMVIAYFGGGSDVFLRGPFRSMWRFPLDVTMLPQVISMGLLRLPYEPKIHLAFAVIPQALSGIVAWYGMRRYRKLAALRRRRAERKERR